MPNRKSHHSLQMKSFLKNLLTFCHSIVMFTDLWSPSSRAQEITYNISLGSADRRCSNYIWVINNFIAYQVVAYTRGLKVYF